MNESHNDRLPSGETRRAFLRKAATLAAVAGSTPLLNTPVYGQAQSPSANVTGANNRIVMGYIGTGAQGMTHVRHDKESAKEFNLAQAAVCDLYQKRLNEARTFLGLGEADAFRDQRRLLERKDIDAVVVATVDVWHGQCAIDALEAGKHVYGEKPMTRYLPEAFALYDMVKRTGKVFQIGSQFCSDPMFHKAAEWIKAGKIGPLVWGQGSYCRNNPKNSEWTYAVDPDANEQNLDWYRWLGRAPKIPWNPEHFFSWHKYYTYNSGLIGNLLPHRFYPLMLSTGSPEYPRRVCATGTRKVSTDREITDTTHLLAEFPSGLTLCIAGSTVNEVGVPDVLRGRKATLYFSSSHNKVELKPERIFSEEFDIQEFSNPLPVASVPRHRKNWLDCIRQGGQPNGNIDLALKGHVVLGLAEMSERLGLALFFDEKTRAIKTADGKAVPPLTYDTVIPPHPA
jgi:predicted dehydrogenase